MCFRKLKSGHVGYSAHALFFSAFGQLKIERQTRRTTGLAAVLSKPLSQLPLLSQHATLPPPLPPNHDPPRVNITHLGGYICQVAGSENQSCSLRVVSIELKWCWHQSCSLWQSRLSGLHLIWQRNLTWLSTNNYREHLTDRGVFWFSVIPKQCVCHECFLESQHRQKRFISEIHCWATSIW